jgi:transposase
LAPAPRDDATLYVSLELSRSTWLVTSLSARGDKMSKHTTVGGDASKLLVLLARLRGRAEQLVGRSLNIAVIQEAGLDGFRVHRLLEAKGIESHVVDPASIAVSRRRRRAKTDAIDGETLLRTLLAWKRGEPRVCEMVVPPTPEEEDSRRLSRERATLLRERVRHVNRIKGLLAGQGISGYDPLHKDRRTRLDGLMTGDGRPLPGRLKAELLRELARLELLLMQIADLEAERNAALKSDGEGRTSPIAMLVQLKAIGPQIGAVLYDVTQPPIAGFGYTLLSIDRTAFPWCRYQFCIGGHVAPVGKTPVEAFMMIELAWLWLRHQPDSALSGWFRARVGNERGRIRRITIVALARKLLIALWRYVTKGEVPEGAVLKPA